MKKISDHLGNVFNSINDMCKKYGISKSDFMRKKDSGMSIEEILTDERLKAKNTEVVDEMGNRFSSKGELCKYYGISVKTYNKRVKGEGAELQDVLQVHSELLEKDNGEITDHKGNVYSNLQKMCEHYGITEEMYNAERRMGLSQKEIFEGKIKKIKFSDEYINYLAKEAKEGNDMAKSRLAVKFMPFIMKWGKICCERNSTEIEDVMQEGYLALLQAINGFAEKEDRKDFSPYAFAYIKGSIQHYCSTKSRLKVEPTDYSRIRKNYYYLNIKYKNEYGREITTEEAAKEIKISTRKLNAALASSRSALSLNFNLDNDDNAPQFEAYIGDEEQLQEMYDIEDTDERDTFKKMLSYVLSKYEYDYVMMRYGFNKYNIPMSIIQISRIRGGRYSFEKNREHRILNELKGMWFVIEMAKNMGIKVPEECQSPAIA